MANIMIYKTNSLNAFHEKYPIKSEVYLDSYNFIKRLSVTCNFENEIFIAGGFFKKYYNRKFFENNRY